MPQISWWSFCGFTSFMSVTRLYPAFWITGTQSSAIPNSMNLAGASFGITFSGRICGKNNTSWMVLWPVISITRRSIPIPIPEVGGIPYSNARTKSLSIIIASSSPFSLSLICSSKRSSWSIGSFNSEYALHNSLPFTISSKRSVKSGLLRCFFVSGDISIG